MSDDLDEYWNLASAIAGVGGVLMVAVVVMIGIENGCEACLKDRAALDEGGKTAAAAASGGRGGDSKSRAPV